MSEAPNSLARTESFEFDALQEAANYRAALLREFAPHLRGDVLEVGAGIGQFSTALAAQPTVRRLVCVEPEPRFCRQFAQLHPTIPLVAGVLDDVPPDEDFDAIVCINVLEHIAADTEELVRFRQRLAKRRGALCLFVPARPEIYAPIDRDFGHHRRYRLGELRGKLLAAGLQPVRCHYFNWVGYFAWWLNFRVLRQRHFEVGSVRLFDRWIFPAVHAMETRLGRPPVGQSLLAVATPVAG